MRQFDGPKAFLQASLDIKVKPIDPGGAGQDPHLQDGIAFPLCDGKSPSNGFLSPNVVALLNT